MNDRWQRVEEIFQKASELSDAERQSFLEAVCGSDDALKREVERLLASNSESGGFLKAPAIERMAEEIQSTGILKEGSTIGPYTVGPILGRGGMGEVVRAHDPRLGRDVAIKGLPASFASDADRLRRFEREARLLASLNHANIASVYGLEESDGARFLVMELVEGPTLENRDRFRSKSRSRSPCRSPPLWRPRTRRASSTGT